MKTIELVGLEKTLYHETLKNGLEIYLLPYEDKTNYYISYATRYGSDVLSFKDSEEYTPPLGVAHYLEHKLFEEPSGEDPFTFFANSGSDGNASTSYDNTQYICMGSKNFKENLEYLLRFVNNPYFTDENVEKEKGIIAEEIKMYNDQPDYKLEMKLRENLYHISPRRYDIAGSIDEIKRITKEDLYKCYEAFYKPNNMFVLITGKFDPEEALKVIKEQLDHKIEDELPTIIKVKEPKSVVKEEETIKETIEIPKIGYGIKVPKSTIPLEEVERNLYLNMFSTILFGASSEFRERVRESKVLNDLYIDWEEEENYYTFYLLASTTSPEELLEEIKYEFSHISITENSLERIKKVWIANEIKMIDSPEKAQSYLFDDLITYKKPIPNRMEIIKKMDIKTLEKLVKEIDLSHRSILKMLPKKSKKERNYDS